MKKQKIMFLGLMAMIVFALPMTVSAQSDGSELQTETEITDRRKADKEARAKLMAEVEAIKNDPSLSKDQKADKINELENAFREERGQMGKRRDRMKRKGKFKNAEERKAWQKEKELLKAELEKIDYDTSLTEEEKKAKKEEAIKSSMPALKANRGKGHGHRKGKGQKKYFKGKEGKDKIDSEPHEDSDIEENIKGDHPRAKKKMWKQDRVEKFVKNNMTPERRAVATKRLDSAEKRLAKDLEKGKIDQATFDIRMVRIEQVRAQLKEK